MVYDYSGHKGGKNNNYELNESASGRARGVETERKRDSVKETIK